MEAQSPHFHTRPNGQRLAFERLKGRGSGLMFLGGFMSDMTGTKACFLRDYCQRHHRPFLRFDYRGHGQSDGAFIDGRISDWLDDALLLLENHTDGPQCLIGSSMGGWLMLEVARRRPERVAALIGIAAAPDFTEELMLPALTSEQQQELMQDGVTYLPSAYGDPYPVTSALLEDGRAHRFFQHPSPAPDCPVALLHGMEDEDVPWQFSQRIAEHLSQNNVTIHLMKDGDHRLSREGDLQWLEVVLNHVVSRQSSA